MIELIAGLVVAVAALALVLEPLVRFVPAPGLATATPEFDVTDVEESDSPKVRALLALKEIEFDRATGKLSDDDYASLKSRYAAQALAAIQQEDAAATAATHAAEADASDPAEVAIARMKAAAKGGAVCPACGPRPETSAAFCSSCGRSLVAPGGQPRCWRCGASVEDGAKFCSSCGGQIGAEAPLGRGTSASLT